VFGLPRGWIGRAGLDPPARPACHRLPSGAQHHPCESVRAPDGDGHILPEVAVVEVAGRQRADLEDGAGAALKLDDARHMIGTRMVFLVRRAPLRLAQHRPRARAAQPQHGVDEMRADPQHRRARGGVEEADLADAAVLDDLLHAPPVGSVLELVADDRPHISRAQVDDAPGLDERQRERLLERDGAHTVAYTELHEGKAHGRWSRETQHVGTLGREHRVRVRVGTRDAERAGERGDPLLLQVAHCGQLEAVRVREQAERVASPAPTAAGQDGPISGLHARILRHGDDSRTLLAADHGLADRPVRSQTSRWIYTRENRATEAFESALDRRLGFHPYRVLATDFGLATWPAGAQEKMGDSRVQVTVKADIVRLDDVDVLRQGSWVAVLGTSDLTKGNAIALTPARGYAGG